MWDWSSPTRYGNQCASVPKDGIGENHKSQLLRLVSVIRFARCEVISVTGSRWKIRQNQSNLWPTHRLEGRPDGKDEEQKGEAEPPLGHHLDPPLHLPRPPPLNCPQAAQLPALLRPPAPASRGAPTGLLGGGPVSFLLGARRARSGCG